MANFLSEAAQFNQYQAPGDLNLINSTLAINQAKYDQGEKNYENNLAQLKVQEGLLRRPEDKDRFAQNVQGLINEINGKEGGINWAKRGLTNKINNYTNKALDSYTLDQIGISQTIRAFDTEVAKKKEKNDGTYADQNVMFAQDNAKLGDYLRGKDAQGNKVDKIGNLSYENYTDYHKELKNIADNLDKYDHDVKKQFRGTGDNEGYFVNREGKELTAQDLKAKTDILLTGGAKKQMQIDGYATYNVGNTEEEKLANVKSKFSEFRVTLEKTDKEKLLTMVGLLKNDPTNKEYILKVDELTTKIGNTKTDFDNIEKSKSAMYTTMYTESTVRNFANTFAIDDVYDTLSDDSGYWHKKDLEYKVNKDMLDAQTKVKTNLNDVQAKFTPAPLDEQSSAYDHQQETITALQSGVDEKSNAIYASLPQGTKNSVDDLVKNSKGKLTRDGAIVSIIGKSSNLVKLADIIALDESRNALLNEKTTFNKYVKQVSDEASKSIDNPKFVDAMYNSPNIKILYNGKMTPAKDVLSANGISVVNGKLVGSISAKPELLQAFNKSIIADKTLSSSQTFDYFSNIKRLAGMMGENIDDILKNGKTTYTGGSGMGQYQGAVTTQKVLDLNSKTGKFLEAHKKGGGYNRDGIFSADDSFDDVSSNTGINTFLDFDVKTKVNKLLGEDRTLAMNKSFMITPNTDMFKLVASQVGDAVIPNAGNSIKLSLIAGQPSMVRVSQLQKGEKNTTDTKIADIRMQDLPSEVLEKINFQNTKQAITVANSENIKSKVAYTDTNDINRILDLQETVLAARPDLAYQTTKSGVDNFIFNDRRITNVVGTSKEPTQTGSVIKKVLEDSNIQVAVVLSGTRYFVEISRQVGDKNTVILRTPDQVDDSNIGSVYKMVKYAPETYVAEMLHSMAIEETAGSSEVLKTLTEIYGK